MKNPRKKLVVALLLVLVSAAALVWLWHARSAEESSDYLLAPVEWGNMSEMVGATGLLQPQEVLVVSSPLSGQVLEIYPGADVNKIVHEGDPLLKLDDRLPRGKLSQAEAAVRLAQADIARAEAARDLARIELRRARDLEKKELTAAWSVELAQGQLRAAEAGVQAARARLAEAQAAREQAELGEELTTVRVPGKHSSSARRSYLILDRKVVAGQLIAPPESARLFTLAEDVSTLRVHAQVSEDDVGKINAGLSATFTVRSDQDEDVLFEGRVTDIQPMPTQLHGAVFYSALIDVANKRNPRTREWLLRPGMTVSVNIVRRTHADVWKLPAAALDTELEKQPQNADVRARLTRWRQRPDGDQWRAVWVLDARRRPAPIFVRTGGVNASGEKGIADGQYLEVLEWGPELEPRPNPRDPTTYPQVIIGAPAGKAPGGSDQPSIKIF